MENQLPLVGVLVLICFIAWLFAGCGEERREVRQTQQVIPSPQPKIKEINVRAFTLGSGAETPEDLRTTLNTRIDSILHSESVYPLWVKAEKIPIYSKSWCVTPVEYSYNGIDFCPAIKEDDDALTFRICYWLGYHYNQITRKDIQQ